MPISPENIVNELDRDLAEMPLLAQAPTPPPSPVEEPVAQAEVEEPVAQADAEAQVNGDIVDELEKDLGGERITEDHQNIVMPEAQNLHDPRNAPYVDMSMGEALKTWVFKLPFDSWRVLKELGSALYNFPQLLGGIGLIGLDAIRVTPLVNDIYQKIRDTDDEILPSVIGPFLTTFLHNLGAGPDGLAQMKRYMVEEPGDFAADISMLSSLAFMASTRVSRLGSRVAKAQMHEAFKHGSRYTKYLQGRGVPQDFILKLEDLPKEMSRVLDRYTKFGEYVSGPVSARDAPAKIGRDLRDAGDGVMIPYNPGTFANALRFALNYIDPGNVIFGVGASAINWFGRYGAPFWHAYNPYDITRTADDFFKELGVDADLRKLDETDLTDLALRKVKEDLEELRKSGQLEKIKRGRKMRDAEAWLEYRIQQFEDKLPATADMLPVLTKMPPGMQHIQVREEIFIRREDRYSKQYLHLYRQSFAAIFDAQDKLIKRAFKNFDDPHKVAQMVTKSFRRFHDTIYDRLRRRYNFFGHGALNPIPVDLMFTDTALTWASVQSAATKNKRLLTPSQMNELERFMQPLLQRQQVFNTWKQNIEHWRKNPNHPQSAQMIAYAESQIKQLGNTVGDMDRYREELRKIVRKKENINHPVFLDLYHSMTRDMFKNIEYMVGTGRWRQIMQPRLKISNEKMLELENQFVSELHASQDAFAEAIDQSNRLFNVHIKQFLDNVKSPFDEKRFGALVLDNTLFPNGTIDARDALGNRKGLYGILDQDSINAVRAGALFELFEKHVGRRSRWLPLGLKSRLDDMGSDRVREIFGPEIAKRLEVLAEISQRFSNAPRIRYEGGDIPFIDQVLQLEGASGSWWDTMQNLLLVVGEGHNFINRVSMLVQTIGDPASWGLMRTDKATELLSEGRPVGRTARQFAQFLQERKPWIQRGIRAWERSKRYKEDRKKLAAQPLPQPATGSALGRLGGVPVDSSGRLIHE